MNKGLDTDWGDIGLRKGARVDWTDVGKFRGSIQLSSTVRQSPKLNLSQHVRSENGSTSQRL